jgi:hypothetical protein
MELAGVLDQREEQFCIWKGVSLLSFIRSLQVRWTWVHKPWTVAECSTHSCLWIRPTSLSS